MTSENQPLTLKHTNVSRPQLQHTTSTQSVAASEDYFSLSESPVPSTESDDRSRVTAIRRYQTPPSRTSPKPSHARIRPGRSSGQLEAPRADAQAPAAVTFKNTPTIRQVPSTSTISPPPAARSPRSKEEMDSISPSTTPGMDHTPYIRFAIDQLTRDEEVRGSRQYGGRRLSAWEPDDDDTGDRLIDDEGLGYVSSGQSHDHASLSRPLQAQSAIRVRPGTVILSETEPTTPAEERPTNGPRHPKEPPAPRIGSGVRFEFAPEDHFGKLDLEFLPGILRPMWMSIFMALVLAVFGLLLASAVYSGINEGLWLYEYFGGSRYCVLRYLPAILGMIILLWVFQIQIALQRVCLFHAMAVGCRDTVNTKLYPTQFIFPNLRYFQYRQFAAGVFSIAAWLCIFMVPLLSASYNVWYHKGRWYWLAVLPILGVALGILAFLLLASILLLFYLMQIRRKRQTGLKWDARSLADIITLLSESNIVSDFTESETWRTATFDRRLREVLDRASEYNYRVGFWQGTRPNERVYTIGRQGSTAREYVTKDGKVLEINPRTSYSDLRPDKERIPGDFSIRLDIRHAGVRFRYLPWFLKDSAIIALATAAIVLLIAWLIVSFVNSAVIKGFVPQVSSYSTSYGFSSANFLFSFLPSAIAMMFFLLWQTIDMTLRGLQPLASLARPGGATAEESLLADYTARLPFSVTLSALVNSHFRVALVSFLTLTAATIPALAGGCFWALYHSDDGEVRVSAHTPGYYALCFFLSLYAVGYLVLLPSRRQFAFPHRSRTLAEIISWVYMSPVLTDYAFVAPATKIELVTRLMGGIWAEQNRNRSFPNLVTTSITNLRDFAGVGPRQKTTQSVSSLRSQALTALPRMTKPPADGDRLSDEPKEKPQQTALLDGGDRSEGKNAAALDPGSIRYGFGIYLGRDGLEHLGIDRLSRPRGREMIMAHDLQHPGGSRRSGQNEPPLMV